MQGFCNKTLLFRTNYGLTPHIVVALFKICVVILLKEVLIVVTIVGTIVLGFEVCHITQTSLGGEETPTGYGVVIAFFQFVMSFKIRISIHG